MVSYRAHNVSGTDHCFKSNIVANVNQNKQLFMLKLNEKRRRKSLGNVSIEI